METQYKIIGFNLIFLALLHIIFPQYFNWKEELQKLNLINREMMVVHTFFVSLTVLLMGLLCITSPYELLHSTLGKKTSLGFCLFWSIRLFIQFFGYSSSLWKKKQKKPSFTLSFRSYGLTWQLFF